MGMRIVGALLMTNLLIYPAVSSMKLLRSFKGVLICSACVSVFCFLLGIVTSCVLGTPAGAGIVVMNIIVYAVVSVFMQFQAEYTCIRKTNCIDFTGLCLYREDIRLCN